MAVDGWLYGAVGPTDGKTSPLTIRDSEEVGSSSFSRTAADHRRPMYLTYTWIKRWFSG